MTTREPKVREAPARHADPAGNQRLTAMTGAELLVLFVAECLLVAGSGPGTGQWIQWHHMSFLLWALVMLIHLGSYLPKLPGMLSCPRTTPAVCWPPGPPAGCCCAVRWPAAPRWRWPPTTSLVNGAARGA